MSAQAVLSMIAPALPVPSQGPSDAGASGFEGLLAALLAAEGPVPAATGVAIAPAGDEATVDAAAPPMDAADPSVLTSLPAMAVPLPTPAPAPLSVSPMGVTDTKAPADVSDAAPLAASAAAPSTASSNDSMPSPPIAPADDFVAQAAVEAAATSAAPQVQPGPATTKMADPPVHPRIAAAKGATPQVKGPDLQAPPIVDLDVDASTPPSGQNALEIPLTDGEPSAAPLVRSSAVPTPTPTPSPTPTPAAPPPLRALAERTSKPLDPTAQTAGSTVPNETRPAAAAAASSTPTPPEQSGKPVLSAAAAPAAPTADTALASAKTAPAGDPAAAQSEAAAPARDHALSTLSRATIDATAQIAAQILRKLEGRSTRFEIALRPAELGRVDVKLDIDAEGRLAARLAFDNPAAATDLRGRVDDLRRQLEAAGFQLADDAFEFADRDSGSSAFDRGQDPRHGQNRAFAAAARLNAEIDMAQPPQWLALSLSPSGVDMKV